MRYGELRKFDVTNGEGVRTTLFVTGCTHRCDGCFNSDLQSFSSGEEFTKVIEDTMIDYAKSPVVKGVSILGGEPFQQDTEQMISLFKRVKDEVGKPIWVWTGYTYEQIISNKEKLKMLGFVDVLIDGKYEKEKADISIYYRGSKNQRVIDVKETLKLGNIVLYVE